MVRVDGELDGDGGQTVLTTLRSLTEAHNLDPDDIRTPAQRRADALVDLCADTSPTVTHPSPAPPPPGSR